MLWIYDLSEPLFGLICCGSFLLLGILGYFLTRPVVRAIMGPDGGRNQGVDAVIGAVTLLYGLILTLIAVAAWQQWVSAQNTVTQEAATLRSIYSDVDSFPQPHRDTLTGELRDYAKAVIEQEWPMQQSGQSPTAALAELDAFERSLFAFEPTTERAKLVTASAVNEFAEMVKLRATRMNTATTGIPMTLWATLLVGALLTTLSTYFLQIERLSAQLAMTGFVTLLIAVVVFMTAVVDYPFRGTRGMSIAPDAFKLVYELNMRPPVH